ncbi:MAG: hypothetical protein WDA27_10720 [Actinomycetota bacterium]
MTPGREQYLGPVGIAREPAGERRRWIGRIALAGFVLLISWLLVNRVIHPPADEPSRAGIESTLPGGS